MKQSEMNAVKVTFSFPGTNVVMELITRENPMTPYREKNIRALRASGYKVLVWNEKDLQTPEDTDRKMMELYKELGMDVDKARLEKYKDKRYQLHERLFGCAGK